MKDKLLLFFFKISPKSLISRLFGYIARITLPDFLINFIIKHYCSFYKVNQDEIDFPKSGFKSFDQFFTRKLKPGTHKIDAQKVSVTSPVDARVDQFGKITSDSIIQAKGILYKIKDLIPSVTADLFMNGSFITLYLSPADYHRIHSPVSGTITGYFHIPGKLFSVQEYVVNGIAGLFTKNERLLSYIQNKNGMVCLCKIGAMNVGRITLSYADIETNKFNRTQKEYFFPKDKEPKINKGDEIGIFHLGSTIVLLFQSNNIKFVNIKIGQKVRVGQKIASYM